MDSAQVLTIVGVVAGIVAAVVAWLQLQRTPRLPRRDELVDSAATPSVIPGQWSPPVGTVLRPPTGRLPGHVWGRDDIIHQLVVLAGKPDGHAHLLTGLGGSGKTTVALAIAEQLLGRNKPVWWVSAVEKASLTSQLLELARLLGAADGEVDEALAGQRSPADLLWRFLEAHSGWVMVIDNADDPDVLALDWQRVGDGTTWVRPTRAGLVLLTSRTADPLAWGRHVEIHSVGWLNNVDGARVLQSLAPHAGSAQDAATLSSRLGGLPLALHHAGLHLASHFAREKNFHDYCQALQNSFPLLMSEGPDDRSVVISTWELSLDQLAAKGLSQSRALLLVVACFAPAISIPWFLLDHSILARVCHDHRSEDVGPGLDALRTVGLIELRPSGKLRESPTVVVHPLVAETILFRSKTGNLGQLAVRTAVDLLGAAVDSLSPDTPEQWPSWALLVPHIDALLARRLPELDESGLVVLARAARLISDALIWSGAYISSKKLAAAVLNRTMSRLPEHEEILRLRRVRAMANLNLRMLDESEQELRAIVMIQRRILGSDNDDTISSSHELAATLARQGQFREAETLYRDILERRARLCHPDRYSFSSRHELARVLAEQGRFDEAESQYRDLLASRIGIEGFDYPKTIITRFRMAELVEKQGRIEEAEHLFQDILSDSVKVFGPEHPDTLKIRYGLAALFADEGRTIEADLQYQEVLSGQRKVFGISHPTTIITENALRSLREHGTI